MNGELESSPANWISKKWDRLFFTNRPFDQIEGHAASRRELNAVGNSLDIFLEDSESSVPSSAAEEIRGFCKGVSQVRLNKGTGSYKRSAWMDDRRYHPLCSEEVRNHPPLLTDTELLSLLTVSKFNRIPLGTTKQRSQSTPGAQEFGSRQLM